MSYFFFLLVATDILGRKQKTQWLWLLWILNVRQSLRINTTKNPAATGWTRIAQANTRTLSVSQIQWLGLIVLHGTFVWVIPLQNKSFSYWNLVFPENKNFDYKCYFIHIPWWWFQELSHNSVLSAATPSRSDALLSKLFWHRVLGYLVNHRMGSPVRNRRLLKRSLTDDLHDFAACYHEHMVIREIISLQCLMHWQIYVSFCSFACQFQGVSQGPQKQDFRCKTCSKQESTSQWRASTYSNKIKTKNPG